MEKENITSGVSRKTFLHVDTNNGEYEVNKFDVTVSEMKCEFGAELYADLTQRFPQCTSYDGDYWLNVSEMEVGDIVELSEKCVLIRLA